MNETPLTTARGISDRRLAYLTSQGEDTRRTVAWRDAVAERQQIERTAAFNNWKATR